jgi:hypothetical protein
MVNPEDISSKTTGSSAKPKKRGFPARTQDPFHSASSPQPVRDTTFATCEGSMSMPFKCAATPADTGCLLLLVNPSTIDATVFGSSRYSSRVTKSFPWVRVPVLSKMTWLTFLAISIVSAALNISPYRAAISTSYQNDNWHRQSNRTGARNDERRDGESHGIDASGSRTLASTIYSNCSPGDEDYDRDTKYEWDKITRNAICNFFNLWLRCFCLIDQSADHSEGLLGG